VYNLFAFFAPDREFFFGAESARRGGLATRMIQLLKARLLFLPTLAWNVLLGRVLKLRRWWDEIEPRVLIGALPFARDVPRLAASGVTAVVNTCEEWSGNTAAYDKAGIRQLRIPIVDFTHPTLAEVQKGVKFIESELQRGGKVYVHCKAGRGRSATLVACWLIAARQMSRQQAQKRLSERRPHVNPRIADRPVVIEFERQVQAAAPGPIQPQKTSPHD
jgi:atypical dual specificity phosphatase